jgi:hypothetical protein
MDDLPACINRTSAAITTGSPMNNRNRLTTYILVGLVLGIAAGYIAHTNLADPAGLPTRCRW